MEYTVVTLLPDDSQWIATGYTSHSDAMQLMDARIQHGRETKCTALKPQGYVIVSGNGHCEWYDHNGALLANMGGPYRCCL